MGPNPEPSTAGVLIFLTPLLVKFFSWLWWRRSARRGEEEIRLMQQAARLEKAAAAWGLEREALKKKLAVASEELDERRQQVTMLEKAATAWNIEKEVLGKKLSVTNEELQELRRQQGNKTKMVFDKRFTCPERWFFLTEPGYGPLTKAAMSPRMLGGNGMCEILAVIGDAVLDLYVAKALLSRYPNINTEGDLTERKKGFVSNAALAKLSDTMHILSYFHPAKVAEPQFSPRQAATIVEALIGAAFMAHNGDPGIMRRVISHIMSSSGPADDGSPVCVVGGIDDGKVVGMVTCNGVLALAGLFEGADL